MKDALVSSMIYKNIVYVVLTLLAIGGICTMVKLNTSAIAAHDTKIIELFKKSADLRTEGATVSVKLDNITDDLKDIKSDLKEVKAILYKPSIKNDNRNDTKIAKSN